MQAICHMLLRQIQTYALENRDPQVAWLRQRLEAGRVKESRARRYMQQLQPLVEYVEQTGNFLDRAPTRDDFCADGSGVKIGELIESDRVPVHLNLWGRWPTVLVTGSAGSGKTVLIRQIIKQVHAWNYLHPDKWITLIIIDTKKDFFDLPDILGPEFVLLSAHHGLKLGLNGPDEAPPRIWANPLTHCLGARLGLIAARTTTASIIHWGWPLLNPDPAQNPLRYPDFRWIRDVIARAGETFATKADYTKWLTQALTGMIQDSGEIYTCANGLEINRDVIARGKHLILDLSNLPDYLRNFIIDQKILDVMVPRLEKGLKAANTSSVMFIIGECDPLLKAERDYERGLSPPSWGIRTGREEQVMFVLEVSALENAPPQSIIDARDIFVFNMSNARSIRIAREILQIDPRCDRLIASLQPGECLARSTQTAWPFTFLMKTDFMPPARNHGAIQYDTCPFIPAQPLDTLPHVLDALDQRKAEHRKARLRHKTVRKESHSNPAIDLLHEISRNLFYPLAKHFDRLGITSGSTKTRLQKELKDAGLATFERFSIGRRRIVLPQLTDAGWKTVGKQPPTGQGKGGLRHRYLAHAIKLRAESQGRSATLEWLVPGTTHPVDVMVDLAGRLIVYEVCVECVDNLSRHLQACFVDSNAVAEMVIVAATQKDLAAIKKTISADPAFQTCADRIRFEPADSFLED